jgi:hypothetical protein
MKVSKRDSSAAGNSSGGSTARRVRRFGTSIGKTALSSRALGMAVAGVALSAVLPAVSQGAIVIHDALATTGPNPDPATTSNTSTTDSLTYTVSPGASVLVVQLGFAADSYASTPSVTWNGTSLTGYVETSSASTNVIAAVYYLLNPTPGTHTITTTNSVRASGMGAFSLSGVNTAYAGVSTGIVTEAKSDTSPSSAKSTISLTGLTSGDVAVVTTGNRTVNGSFVPGTSTITLTDSVSGNTATQQWLAVNQPPSTFAAQTGGIDFIGGSNTTATISNTISPDQGSRNEIAAVVFAPATTVPAISISSSATRFLAGSITAGVISGNVTNTGSSNYNFTSIVNTSGETGTLSSISPQTGNAVATSGSVPYTASINGTGATPGTTYTFGTTVTDGTTPASSGTVSLTAVSARSFSQTSPNPVNLGNVFVSTTTSSQTADFSTTGTHNTTTDVTVNANATATDGSATLSNGATAQVFNGPDGAAHSGTLSVTGNFASAGTDTGTLSLTAANGLTAELGASGNLSVAYTANVFDHALITAGTSPQTMRLTQGSSKSVTYALTNAGASAQRDSGTVSSGGSANTGFSTNFSGPVTVGSGTSSSNYSATYTAAAANGTSSPTGTYNFTYGDTDTYAGHQTGQTATLTVNAKVDAIAEHVTSNTDTGNANTTSTAAYRQLSGYGGNNLGTATVTKVGAGSYIPGFIDNINGGAGVSRGTATVAVVPSGQSFNGETGVFLLDFGDPTTDLTTNLTNLDADLAAGGYAFYDDVTGAHNGVATDSTLAAVDPHLGAGHAYDLELDLGGTGTTNPTYFDFDFGKYNTGSGLLVENLAVIPEPSATIALMGVATVALLPRRRRRKLA